MNHDDIRKKLTPALAKQLDELVGANHCGAGSIMQSLDRTELRARLASVDRLACESEMIAVSHPRFKTMSVEQMQVIGDELVARLSYLEERLVVLEIDPAAREIQLRSDAPRLEDDERSYFEVQVGESGITLKRFAKQTSAQRIAVSAALTRSIFTRVCIDMVAVASA